MSGGFVILLAALLIPGSARAQGNNKCPINPFLGGRQLHTEGTSGDMVYIVCIDLDFPYLRFKTVMANDVTDVNERPDSRETVSSMAKREPYNLHWPVVALNADYFGRGHGPEGLTVVNGIRLDGPDNGDCDNREYSDCHDNAIYRASLSFSRLNAVEISHKDPREIANEIIQSSRFYNSVGGGPILVLGGEAIENPCGVPSENVTAYNCSDTQQTAIGVSEDGKILIIVVAESKTGEEMGEILVRYGAYTAIKLDGGGSSQLWFENKLVYHDPKEGVQGRPVANAILIFREKIPRHDSIVVAQSEFPIAKPGEAVELSFELQNRGFLTWERELPYAIRFSGGDRLGLSQYYPLSKDVLPGESVKWTQTIVAPQETGTYQSIWQMTYEDAFGNVEAIGPKIGYVVTVLPEGSSFDLESAIQQLLDQAQQEAEETLKEFLSRIEDEINKRIEEEMQKITVCGQPVFAMIALVLVLGRKRRHF